MNRYSRYEDAMIAQQQQLRWLTSDDGLRYLQFFFGDMDRQHKPEHRRDPRALSAIQLRTLMEAEPIYASAEACEMVSHAKETFEPERALPGDPFTPFGFALLGQPIVIDDAPWHPAEPGRSLSGLLPIRALSWASVHNEDWSQGCFWISFYIDVDDEEAMAAASREHEHYEAWMKNREHLRGLPSLMLGHQFQWTWGDTPWTEPDRLEIAATRYEPVEDVIRRSKAQSRMVQAFWRIASQFAPAKERAPRGIWRDFNRKVNANRDVTVIRLRRLREGKEVEPAGRGLSVRFPVRGHWRNQWYPSLEEHRQIWIHPYIKGPDGARFVMKQRVWEFTR